MSQEKDEAGLSGNEERGLLTSVLDEIIRRSTDGTFPGAGELGVADYIEQALTNQPEIGALLVQGLSTIGTLARGRNPEGFTALSREEKVSVLREVESKEPGFFGCTEVCQKHRFGLPPYDQVEQTNGDKRY